MDTSWTPSPSTFNKWNNLAYNKLSFKFINKMLIPTIGFSFLIVVKNILPVLSDKSRDVQSANFPPKTH